MGMYTELVLATQIADDPTVIAILKHMGEDVPLPEGFELPAHPLFQTTRWTSLFCSCSHYFVPDLVFQLTFNKIAGAWTLISRSDLKNYEGEIEKFIAWITPYLADCNGQMIGYSRYEEAQEPTILYAPGAYD